MTKTLFAATAALGMAASANAAVIAVGEDTDTLSNWRTAANLETDNQYGTQGYVLYGIDSADNVWTQPYDASSLTTLDVTGDSQISLPSYISDIALTANNTGRWSGTGNFGQIEDPSNGNALTNTPVLAHGTQPYTFTITRATTDAFRLTILLADGDGADAIWDTSVDAGAAGSASITGATTNGANNSTYQVYDIGAGNDPVTVTVVNVDGQPGTITGFAFDVVPEPSSAALLGLGGIALILRRRK